MLLYRSTRRSSSTCLPPTSRRDMRVARMIFIIFMMVLICSVPVGTIHFADRNVKMPRRFLALHILYWLQYSLNVFVYVLMNRQYRVAYIDFVARMLPSWERHKTFNFPWENPSVSSRPPQGPNSSFKSKKDSTSQDPSAAPKEYKPVEAIPYSTRGRLSAILEVNSSSCVSSDDVFVGPTETKDKDEKYRNKTAETNLNEEEEAQPSQIKNFPEEGTDEEKQKWLSQNEENRNDQNKEKN
ncbi:RalA-binding protein 1, partial [Armadillidium vulgare]